MSPQEFTAELSKTCHCCTVVEPSAQVGRQVMGRQAFGRADIGDMSFTFQDIQWEFLFSELDPQNYAQYP